MAGSRFNELTDDAMSRLGDGAAYARDRARKAAEVSGRVIGEFAEEAGERGRKAAKYAVRQVRAHPLTTLAIGAAVGGVITYLLLRDRD